MPILETATGFLFDLLIKNEEVKKFPQDFITASMKWVRSWFLTDDPVTETIIDSNQPAAVKEAVIGAKLENLMKNPQFVQELEAQLMEYGKHKARIKNLVDENAEIDAAGSVTVGDKGASTDDGYDQKNIVHGKIKSGGDVTVGDTSYQAGGNFSIVNNYYQHQASGAPVPTAAIAGLKEELRNSVAKGKVGDAIGKLADLSGQPEDFYNTALQLSGRWEQLKRQEMLGILSNSEASVERSKISAAALELVGELP